MENTWLDAIAIKETPLQELRSPLFEDKAVRVLVKREDTNHPSVMGNKCWKLKHNLLQAKKDKHDTLLTFGGAYSNHIVAVAAAGKELGFKTIGVIRGEEHLPLNQTLQFVQNQGMRIQYMDRTTYRAKASEEVTQQLENALGRFYLIPEGGTNHLAVRGTAELAKSFGDEYDYVCCACGTGGTLAGLINGGNSEAEFIGFSALKGGSFLEHDVGKLLHSSMRAPKWRIETAYHFGGYAKKKPQLIEFIQQFEKEHAIKLDYIYNGKLFFGLIDLIKSNDFRKGSTIIVLHSGGIRADTTL